MAKYTPSPDCFDAANAASRQKLTRDEIDAAFQRVADFKQKLQAEGNLDGMADKLRSFAEREAERTRIAAAMSKRHAALNILVRDRLDQAIAGFVSAGMSPKKAVLAVLEGTQKGVQGGRNSVGATNMAYEARYLGGLFAEIQKNRPDLVKAMRDQRLDADTLREMSELREGGRPGITGNKDAQYLAKTFATYAELARTDLNKLGASIGKLDGWAGAQTHDDVKMIKAGKEAWTASVLPKLDTARTFPDAASGDEIVEILGDVYDTIITGFPNQATPAEKGQRVNPANLAKRLGKSRVLHFRDADAALAYRKEFGQGNTVSGIVGHLRNSARVAANMEVLGPNPELMLRSIIDGQKRRIKEDPKLSPAEKQKQIQQLDAEGIQHALGVATGLVSRPVNVTAAKIGSDIRAMQAMSKLGGALWSSLVSDPMAVAASSQFRGSGFFKGFVGQINGMMRGRTKGEQTEIAYLIGEGFDGLIGHIVAPAAAVDGPVGHLSKLQELFFRLNGLAEWTDRGRAAAGRMIAAEMGMRAKSAYAELPANYRHVLGLHGITEAKWDAIRKAGAREIDGKAFVTPDRIRDLPDDAIIPLVQDRIDTANVSLETRKIASRMVDDREKDWIAKRKERLDGWLSDAEKRLDSMLAGNQIRTEIDKQLAQRRIDLEKALIEEARTEIEVLGASREMDAADDVRMLLADARESRKDIDRLAERGQKVVERLGRQDFRGGQELGRKYQAARNRISGLRKQIAKLEREANKKEAGASQRLQDTFQSRLDELNEFMDRAYTREQARADALARDIAEQPNRIKSIIEDGRRDLELSLLRFFADETSYGMIEVDARARRTLTLGQRPGTFAGEAIRFITQFKGFPIAFAQRVGGRALFGHMHGPKSLSYWGHIGTILAGMTMAGYAAMTFKDIAKGYWPPRDLADPATWAAAFVQGGAAGVYGDFLFARVNRFGGGITETAIGPGIGSTFDLIDLILKARDASISAEEEVRLADGLNFALQNTPFINLFYTRPALDYLFINSMREAASPGYLKRTGETQGRPTTGRRKPASRRN